MQEMCEKPSVRSLGREDPLEEEMTTHSSIFCLKNSMDRGAWQATVHGLAKRVGHNSATKQQQAFQSKLTSPQASPFQGPRAGSGRTLGNELSEETHALTKQEAFLGRGARRTAEASGSPGARPAA